MDYKEEQNGEIEALISIYDEDLEMIEYEPFHKFKINIKSEEYDPEKPENGLMCKIVFNYIGKYPDEPPEFEIEETYNLSKLDQKELNEHLEEQIKENLGMVMIFTLVSAVQEWLNNRWDAIKIEREELRLKKEREEEEVERKKFEGTKVSVETFLKWKKQFDEEMRSLKVKEVKKSNETQKLTGRELFMQDISLNDSDLKYLESVKDKAVVGCIDESLFDNVQDLDEDFLDDEDDDPDYVPGKND